MQKQILLINDLPGVGKVALSAMMPILSSMGVSVHTLPTAVVSNTLDYGLFEILDTTAYMKKAIKVWEKLGFRFDCLSTGFITSEEQVSIIEELLRGQTKDCRLIVDPVMGDEGHFYNGLNETTAAIMRRLISRADVITPNFTEALILAELPLSGINGMTQAESRDLVDHLRHKGAKSVIITSMVDDNGEYSVFGYDATVGEYFRIPYKPINVHCPGTGDAFAAVLAGAYLNGHSIPKGVSEAVDFIGRSLRRTMSKTDIMSGMLFESELHSLSEL